MAVSAPPRIDTIEIPDRPAVASGSESARLTRKRVLLYGGIAAATLFLLVVIALLRPGSEKVAGPPADAPVIKAGADPIKVAPETPGGLDVPHRGIEVYQGAQQGKRSVERLLPEPEQPLTPPAPPRPAQTASTPDASPAEPSLTSEAPGDAPAPPALGPSARPPAEPAKGSQSQLASKPKLAPQPTAPDPAAPQAKTPSRPATPAPTAIANAPSTEAPPAQPEKPASGKGFQLQLLSSRSADEAKGAWARLKDKNADLLGSLSPSVSRASLDNRGTFYRLRAGPIANESKARSMCDSLSARGVSCLVVRTSG